MYKCYQTNLPYKVYSKSKATDFISAIWVVSVIGDKTILFFAVTFLECFVVKGLTLHDVQSLVYRNYISISISIHTDIDGHPEPRRFYRDMTSLVCLTVHPVCCINTHTLITVLPYSFYIS